MHLSHIENCPDGMCLKAPPTQTNLSTSVKCNLQSPKVELTARLHLLHHCAQRHDSAKSVKMAMPCTYPTLLVNVGRYHTVLPPDSKVQMDSAKAAK